MGAAQEDATEGGSGIVCLGNVLLRGNTRGAVVWGGDLGVVGANGAKDRRSSCGVPETGDKIEIKTSEGWFVAEDGSRKSTSGIGDTTATYLLGKEAGNSDGMGGLTAYI